MTRAAEGLYHPRHEHDSCGVAFVADLHGRASHDVVRRGLEALRRLDHRGARGADPDTGDGAGVMIQVPDTFCRAVAGFELPPAGCYATGLVFMPVSAGSANLDDEVRAVSILEELARAEGARLLGWRDLPVRSEALGKAAADRPRIRQVFLAVTGPDGTDLSGIALDRVAFCVRRRAERETRKRRVPLYFPSLSGRTLVYKGMLTPAQLDGFFPDLTDHRLTSALALVHSRFSTNTFPSWPLAHPYRFVAHNGEINTIRGNRNWMAAREALLAGGEIDGELARLLPVCSPGGSDSARFDEVLELLHLSGRSLPHAVLMMVPPAWENDTELPDQVRAFHQYHACLMEPWDGPAAIAFTDGTLIGAVLDRNGLRPGRWWRTADDLIVLGSETGILDVPPGEVVAKGRLQPGRMFLVDTAAGRIVPDDELKSELGAAQSYGDWLYSGLMHLETLPAREHVVHSHESVLRRQQTFGYTDEELKLLLAPMARTGVEPIGSMGTDTPIAVLSTRPRPLYDYFTQLFAQVTNPPLDAIREELVTSLALTIGPEADLLTPTVAGCRQVVLPRPVIDNDEFAKIAHLNDDGDLPGFKPVVVSGLYRVRDGAAGLRTRLAQICQHVSEAIDDGARILILSDRDSTADLAPIPSLLLTGAVHHHLVRERTRTKVALVVESGDCREVHHVALLLGYGASAINPYLACESIEDLAASQPPAEIAGKVHVYLEALGRGVVKVMSKMGVSTASAYCGAQLFEAIGLSNDLVEQYFTGTDSRIGGIGLDEIHAEIAARHREAWAHPGPRGLASGGDYQWRRDGELHLFNPESVFLLQHATRARRYEIFRRYTSTVDELAARGGSLRGLLALRTAGQPVPVDEVEPVSSIVTRFATGAMSYGSISAEAHEMLAIAMNSLGARSNSGEGGEEPARSLDPARRSAVRQVASGRFGVTTEYLVAADDLQIKMAQGAKPGEGGQLPGSKVWPWIAKVRHATPGVGLVSPPPHHDIYSIEDLAQLIWDLKNVNPAARVHVKLVAEVGVGTVAAGVAKAKADVILISGHDGGTGASPLGSLKHAGAPWELGLAETQQTLLLNGLRDRVTVQVDGQLKTGRDVIIAALLGAEEFGFATAPLIVAGCVMMRVCHLDTCPVGIATQNPVLRERFTGKPEFVTTFFEYLAEEVRGYLAALGLRSLDEAVGRVDLLDVVPAIDLWKAQGLDLSAVLHRPAAIGSLRRSRRQEHGLRQILDVALIEAAEPALTGGTPVRMSLPVHNADRSVGARLGGEVVRRAGALPDGTIDVTLHGAAGQSFGAFLPQGVTLRLVGDANDYVGKGLSGGSLVLTPAPDAPFRAEEQVIAGNTLLYGATSGTLFARGRAGERFAVRNSGAIAVVEGVGDHGCEYMTGGAVAVLGPTGRNFAAGMSGGLAYVWRLDPLRVNREMVDLAPMTDEQVAELRALVGRHLAETGSAVAADLLGGWADAVAEFTAVVPRQWRRVREAMRFAELAGRDVGTAVMEVASA